MLNADEYKPTERFSNRASQYSKARPDYPAKALDFILERCSLKAESKLVDIGAGTGISSRAFASRGLLVTGVEPNQSMLDEAKNHPDFAEKLTYVKAKAEETGLPSNTFDAVVCAQSFHWFDPGLALAEFNRMLKPGGWIVLLWNERDESDQFTKEYGKLLLTLPDTKLVEMKRGEAGQPLMESKIFSKQDKTCFAHEQLLDLDKLIGRAFSASYAPTPGSEEAADFEQKLTRLFKLFQKDNQVVLKYECSVYTAQKMTG